MAGSAEATPPPTRPFSDPLVMHYDYSRRNEKTTTGRHAGRALLRPPLPVVQQDGEAVVIDTLGVGHSEVGQAVAVKVPHRQGQDRIANLAIGPHGVVAGRSERAVAVAQEHANVPADAVGDDKVGNTVAVQIGYHYG